MSEQKLFAGHAVRRIRRANGLTQDEIAETLTHLAFYSGWPNAVTATGVAREVFVVKP